MTRRLDWRIAIITMAATFCANVHAQTVVKLGFAGPLTGQIANLGKDNERGAQLAIEDINAQHLVIGGKQVVLQLDSQDDAADPRTATQVAQRLVDDGVVAVIGHMTSGTSISASKIYSDAHVAQITPSATNPAYTQQGFATTFRLVATDAVLGPALAQYAYGNLHGKTVAVVDDATAYGQGLADAFVARAQSLGMKVLSHDETNDKAIDFRAILTKIKGEDPALIMYGGMEATAGPFAKQAKQLAVSAHVLGGDGVCSDDLPKLAGDAAANVICAQAGAPLETLSQGAAFNARFQKRFGVPILLYAPSNYDAVNVVVAAMKKADSTDPAKIAAAIRKVSVTGITGPIQFDAKGDLESGTISIYRYENGKKTLISVEKL
ncbi:MAG: branched-chain amino acid ABC transporter substrate-binding protein [Trinickia sp.]|uniref:branched-chain amino acid ABC transporter substrate-binding protein n=1 Tax=Trinickia sp. TaxID=2571163 RepID=UPI003F80B2B3